MNQGRIIVITGSPGTGKTTTASIVAKESDMDKSVHMHTDDFFHYLSKGAIPPHLPESNEQNLVVIEAFLEAAKRYARGGYDVIVDGIVGPWFLEPWRALVREDYEVHYIVLRASKEETMKRAVERSKLDRKGLSQEKVCVPCAVNRNGLSISKITNTGRVSTRDLHHIYDGRIKTNSTLVTDKMNSYVRFTNANGIDLVQLKTGKAKKGIYNIQHINSYHSQLKRFMRGFNGVSTKYLNNYLVWNNLVNYAKESDMEKRNIFLTFVLATLKTAKCRDLSNRPAVPLVA
nr:IS1595 family transposase [Campylobacter coli]